MSVTIRLSRTGRKNLPAYKIVVCNTRGKRSGPYIDILGHYNPSANPKLFKYDKEKFEKWVKTGANVTEAVKKLIEGKYEYVVYAPKKAAKAAKLEAQQKDASTGSASQTSTASETSPEAEVTEPISEPKEDKTE